MPRNLNDSTAVTVLFMTVSGRRAGLGSPEGPQSSPLCFERVKLQIVKTAPDSQLLNLLSVSRLVTVLDEAISVVLSANIRSLTEGSLDMQLFV